MAYYLFHGRYSEASLKAFIDNPQDRKAAAAKMIESIGGKLHHMFFAFGSDDLVALIEAPDDKAMMAGSLLVGASGAMSGGATTKLIPMEDALAAMKLAKKSVASYAPPS